MTNTLLYFLFFNNNSWISAIYSLNGLFVFVFFLFITVIWKTKILSQKCQNSAFYYYIRNSSLFFFLPIIAYFPPYTYFEMYKNHRPGHHPNSKSEKIFESLDFFTQYYLSSQYQSLQHEKFFATVFQIEAFKVDCRPKLSSGAYQTFLELFKRVITRDEFQQIRAIHPTEAQTILKCVREGNSYAIFSNNNRWQQPFPKLTDEFLNQRWRLTTRRIPENRFEEFLMWIDDRVFWIQDHPYISLAVVLGVSLLSYCAINYFWSTPKPIIESAYNSEEAATLFDVYNQVFDKLPQGLVWRNHMAGWSPRGWKWKLGKWEFTVWEPYFKTFARMNQRVLDLAVNFYKDFFIWLGDEILFYVTTYYKSALIYTAIIYTLVLIKQKIGIKLLPYYFKTEHKIRFFYAFLPWWLYAIFLLTVISGLVYLFTEYPEVLDPTQPYYTIDRNLTWSPTVDSHAQNFELYYQYATTRAWYQTRTSVYIKYPFVPVDWPLTGELLKYRTAIEKNGWNSKLSHQSPHISQLHEGLKTAWIFEKWGKKKPKLGRVHTISFPEFISRDEESEEGIFNVKKALKQKENPYLWIKEKLPYPTEPTAPTINDLLQNKDISLFFWDNVNYFKNYIQWIIDSEEIRQKREEAKLQTRMSSGLYGEKYKSYAEFVASDLYWHRTGAERQSKIQKEVVQTWYVSVYKETPQTIELPYWNKVTLEKLVYLKPEVNNFHWNRADEFIVTRNPYKLFDVVGYAKLKTWAKVSKYSAIKQATLSQAGINNDDILPEESVSKLPLKFEEDRWFEIFSHYLNKIDFLELMLDEDDNDNEEDTTPTGMAEWRDLESSVEDVGEEESKIYVPIKNLVPNSFLNTNKVGFDFFNISSKDELNKLFEKPTIELTKTQNGENILNQICKKNYSDQELMFRLALNKENQFFIDTNPFSLEAGKAILEERSKKIIDFINQPVEEKLAYRKKIWDTRKEANDLIKEIEKLRNLNEMKGIIEENEELNKRTIAAIIKRNDLLPGITKVYKPEENFPLRMSSWWAAFTHHNINSDFWETSKKDKLGLTIKNNPIWSENDIEEIKHTKIFSDAKQMEKMTDLLVSISDSELNDKSENKIEKEELILEQMEETLEMAKVHDVLWEEIETMKKKEREYAPPLPGPIPASPAYRQYFIDYLAESNQLENLLETHDIAKKTHGIIFLPNAPAAIYTHIYDQLNLIYEPDKKIFLNKKATINELIIQDDITKKWLKSYPNNKFLNLIGVDPVQTAWVKEQRFNLFNNYPYSWNLWFWSAVVFLAPIGSFIYYFIVEENVDFDRYKLYVELDKKFYKK